ncbi:sulfite exporter TauE/SafE family protein [Marinicella sediminis]|uniref:Probable membrane transporter protein n=1 Tax=Marinicella sediminis TaxID=1792834 RepID=A0ABV7JD44_9GAMM|nr:sulfite exporter TauE/SafE family protein [Marinicella sediminis]
MLSAWLLLILLGMVAGFLAGLFGIGGGALLVPALSAFFLWQQVDPLVAAHMALATSMSCIIFNALLSTHSHHQHQAILWPVVRLMTPAVMAGSLLATFGVLHIKAQQVALIFFLLMLLIALRMLFDQRQEKLQESRTIPGVNGIVAGTFIGGLSAMMAIGGGSLTVPYLTWYGIRIQRAIGTAAALGLPIALTSTLVFSWQNMNTEYPGSQPDHVLGYVYWPATLALTAGSLLTTRMGARLTHQLPVNWLKKIFALMLIFLAWNMYRAFN